MSEELATYSIEFKLEGMRVPDKPAGYGDRSLRFEYAADATDLDEADKAWYAHLQIMLGDDEMERIRNFAVGLIKEKR